MEVGLIPAAPHPPTTPREPPGAIEPTSESNNS
jgi:hypothetical protein